MREAISRFGAEVKTSLWDQPMEVRPSSPFEALLDERQHELRRELEEIKGRVNGVIYVVLGAIGVNLILRLLG